MKVMKFGGAAIATPEKMRQVMELIVQEEEPKIVVLSAVSGTTAALTKIGGVLKKGERETARQLIDALSRQYHDFIHRLLKASDSLAKAEALLASHIEFLHFLLRISYSEALNKDILAQGELLSTGLFGILLRENNFPHALLPALDFMTIDAYDEPQIGSIKVKLTQLIKKQGPLPLFITQGYISRNARGEVDNLKRGGSDYSASLIAAAMEASSCEIWTDVEGMYNVDSKIVSEARIVEQLSFEEAAELAYFGAKILHPASIWPAQLYNIPVRLVNMTDPAAPGTRIMQEAGSVGIKAIAARDGITAIKVKSSRMLLAYGFMRKIFEVFEKYRTPIDMITTSEVAVSVTIDDVKHIKAITKDLETFGTVEMDEHQTIIAIVGNEIAETPDILSRLFRALEPVPVRMVTYGGSRHNISLLIPSSFKEQTLQLLHRKLFGS